MTDKTLYSIFSPQDLSNFSQSVQASDPYNMVAQGLAAWQPQMQTWSPAAQGLTAFGRSFLAGMLGNQAKANAAEQLNKVISLAPSFANDPYSIQTPEGLDESAFSALKNTAILNKQAKESKLAEMMDSVFMKRFEEQAKLMGQADAKKAIYGEDFAKKDPENPQYQIDQNIIKEEDAARNEIAKMPSVAQFNSMQKGLPLVRAFKDADSKSSDMGFVYNYVKALDDTAVRNEEINMAQSSNPLIQQYRSVLEGALTGKSALTPRLKNQMYKELQAAQKNIYAQALLDAQKRYNIAEARGVKDFNKVLNFDPNLTFDPDLTTATIDPVSAIDAALARKGFNPDGTPLRAPLPTSPLRPD